MAQIVNPNPAEALQLALAPAAGKGIGRVLFGKLLEDPEFVDEMKRAVMKGLRAKHTFRDKKTGEIIEVDDPRVMVQTVALILAQAEGDPVKRIIHEHVGGPAVADVGEQLRDSEALRIAVRRELEKAEFRGRHKKAPPEQAGEIVDVA